eukprot:scaffold148026_cov19-Tisochrysis_lutea.AAC.1
MAASAAHTPMLTCKLFIQCFHDGLPDELHTSLKPVIWFCRFSLKYGGCCPCYCPCYRSDIILCAIGLVEGPGLYHVIPPDPEMQPHAAE